VDDQSAFQRADDVYPNPVLPGSIFRVGHFSYSFGEGGQFYSLKDSHDNPWEPKSVYYDVDAARMSLEPNIDLAALLLSESLNLDTSPLNLEEDAFDLNQFDLIELMGLLGTLTICPRHQRVTN
jgi:hypothetical protein